MNYYG
ncbi:Protein of unknown function [Bacillus mobilis]